MKKNLATSLFIIIAVAAIGLSLKAQDKTLPPKYEYSTVKWDGPDRLYFNVPGKFQLVHLESTGVSIPKEAEREEYCLAVAANIMAKDGWEPINLDSRRILFRRPTR